MYQAGFLKHRVTVLNRGESTQGRFGTELGQYLEGGTYWANVTFNKGAQAMREGALDAYDQVMIRMRYNAEVKEDTRFRYNGKDYQQKGAPIILKQEDEIQVICQSIVK